MADNATAMTDDDDFLSDDVPVTTTEDVSPPAPEKPEKADRDEKGRFAAKEAKDEESTGEDDAAPPAADRQDKSHSVPVTALLDEREKRQRIEAEAEVVRRELAEMRRQFEQSQRKPQEAPDILENPEGYRQHVETMFDQRLNQQRLSMSRFMAEREFGKAEVDAAFEFFNKNPRDSWTLIQEPSPFHAAVEAYRRSKAVEEFGTDPTAYREKLRAEMEAELREQLRAEIASEVPDRPKTPPRSLAGMASSSGPPPAAAGDPLFD
jgi:hypothetical protein